MTRPSRAHRLAAEALGTALLLAAVIGSGIMGERLAGGNVAVALMANTAATAAMLYVLITTLGPLSGAHMNPAVTLVMARTGALATRDVAPYIAAQVAGGLAGMLLAHAMFELPLGQLGTKARTGPAQWLSEAVAAFGLVATILLTLRARAEAIAATVALYIASAYWFTASTSFANPAVTIARAFTDTFAGIRPADVAMFIIAQLAGALAAHALVAWLAADDT